MLRRALLPSVAVALTLAAPSAAADSTDPIPASVGPQGTTGFWVNPATPAGLDRDRWVSVATRSLARWGLRFEGLTDQPAGEQTDGLQVIAFGRNAAAGTHHLRTWTTVTTTVTPTYTTQCTPQTATVYVDVPVTRVVRKRKKVVLRRNGRVVRRKGRKVRVWRTVKVRRKGTERQARTVPADPLCTQVRGPDLVEQRSEPHREADITINEALPWELGPDHPSDHEADLESVLLHELGHEVGLGHVAEPCSTATMMTASLAAGDWWRAPDDVSRRNCSGGAGR